MIINNKFLIISFSQSNLFSDQLKTKLFQICVKIICINVGVTQICIEIAHVNFMSTEVCVKTILTTV